MTTRLTSLVRKELVRPDAPQLPGEDAFRFRHLLIRDAAYEALPKAVRADLHERFAFWLEEHGTGIVELDEIVGYHLEQAIRYRRELGHDASADLAVSARIRLRTAGLASSARGDNAAAVKLLERAAALLAPGEIDLALEAQLMESLFWGGRGDDALRRAISLAEQGAASGDRVVELCGRVREWMYRTFRDPEGATDRLEAVIEQALPVFEDAGNDLALYIAHRAAGQVGNMRARADAGRQAFERAAFHAERAGLPERFEGWRALCGVMGTTPPGDVVAWIDELEMTEHWILRQKAHALAMLGRFAEAEELLQAVRAELLDRGELGPLASMDGFQGIYVALLAGEVETAVARGESACAVFEQLGEQSVLSSIAGHLARALCAAERFGEAEEWAARAAELGASDDALTQYLWRQAKARALAQRGEHAEAERLAREAIAVADATDFLDGQADAYSDLAEVLGGAGKVEQARSALDEAIARYERKGNVVMVERTRARLAELQAAVET